MGATASAANFVHPASATPAPRTVDEVRNRKAHTSSAGMIASFVFEFMAYAVNGNASHANTRATASLVPP